MIQRLIAIFTESLQSFHGQEAGEKVVLIIRQHLFTVSYRLGLVFLAAFIPLLVKLIFADQIVMHQGTNLFLFISSLWYAFLWLLGFYTLTLYCLNTVVITDRRIIENEQKGFFNRKVAELHLYRVQDVSVHTEGLIPTLLSFGDITVQTAATEKEFLFRSIANPETVKDIIMQTVSAHRSNLNLS